MSDSKSLYEVAKEINGKAGISLQAVNKRVKNELTKNENKALCDNTTQTEKDGKTSIRLNEEAVKAVYELYNLVDQEESQPVDQPQAATNEAQNGEVTTLRQFLETLKQQLDQKDEQIRMLSKLAENTQILLHGEQTKNKPTLLADLEAEETQPEDKKRNLFERIFHKS